MKKEIFSDFSETFSNRDAVSKNEIKTFLEKRFPTLSESSFHWRLYDLKTSGLITKLNDNLYKINSFGSKRPFKYEFPDESLLKTIQNYNKNIADDSFIPAEERWISIWQTNLLNEFTTHQMFTSYTIIELDNSRTRDLFYHLKENHINCYLDNNLFFHMEGSLFQEKVVFVKPLNKRAPIQKHDKNTLFWVTTPKLEKILIDVFMEKRLFEMYGYSEISNIFVNANAKYNLDFTTLLYYARNRGIQEKTRNFLSDILNFEEKR